MGRPCVLAVCSVPTAWSRASVDVCEGSPLPAARHDPGLNALQLCTCQFGSATVLLRLLLQLRGEYQPLGSESRRMWQVATTYSLGFVLTNLAFSLADTARAAAHATCTHTACGALRRSVATESHPPRVSLNLAARRSRRRHILCVSFSMANRCRRRPAAGLRGDG